VHQRAHRSALVRHPNRAALRRSRLLASIGASLEANGVDL
jgi:hypothetical protein